MCFRCASEKDIGGYSFFGGCVLSAGFFPTDPEKTILPNFAKCRFETSGEMFAMHTCNKGTRLRITRLRICVYKNYTLVEKH
jgi:hypothetical protein